MLYSQYAQFSKSGEVMSPDDRQVVALQISADYTTTTRTVSVKLLGCIQRRTGRRRIGRQSATIKAGHCRACAVFYRNIILPYTTLTERRPRRAEIAGPK